MPHPDSTVEPHGLQLWVNLGAKDKMMEPRYQELMAKDIPHVEEGGVTAIVIAGEAFGTKVWGIGDCDCVMVSLTCGS